MFMQGFRLLCLVFLCLYGGSSSYAQEKLDRYVIDNVSVNIKAEETTQARDQAIQQAQQQALRQLLPSLISIKDVIYVPEADKDTITEMIKGFEVHQETMTENSYAAQFRITFYEAKVRDFLKQAGLRLVEDSKLPMMVIPLLRKEEDYILWGEDNPWLQAWNQVILQGGGVEIMIPLGDLEDMDMIEIEDVIARDYTVLQLLAKKYGAVDIVIMEANIKDSKVFEVTMQPVGESNFSEKRKNFSGYTESIMMSAVKELIVGIEDYRTEVKKLPVHELLVTYSVSNIQDWLAVKAMLEGLEVVKEVTIQEMNNEYIKLNLSYQVDFDNFSAMLQSEGLALLNNQGDWWLVDKE